MMSNSRRLPAAALSTLFFAMHAGAFRLGVSTGERWTKGLGLCTRPFLSSLVRAAVSRRAEPRAPFFAAPSERLLPWRFGRLDAVVVHVQVLTWWTEYARKAAFFGNST